MCLAIFKPAGVDIPESRLKSGWLTNPGGAGFAYLKKNKVEIEKGFMKLQDFLEALNKALQKNKKSKFLIHFRVPSMGSHDPFNTHPFPFKHGALIHNGTIFGTGAVHGSGPSDTAKFTERYGDRLTFSMVEANKHSLNEALGYNKVVILYSDGQHQILNEPDGVWVDDVWYSNKHSLPPEDRANGTRP